MSDYKSFNILQIYKRYKSLYLKDTDKLIDNIKTNRLETILYYEIKNNQFKNILSEEQENIIKKNALSKMIRAKLKYIKTMELFKAFNEELVQVVALKGIIIRSYYVNPELRTMTDIDLLVRENDMNKCENILLRLGYTYDHETPAHKVYKDKNNLIIELHSTLIDEDYYKKDNPYLDVFERIRSVELGDEKIYVLGYTDQLIHLITHMMTHISSSSINIRQFLDIALFVNKENEKINFADFKYKGEVYGFYKNAILILSICDDMFECNIPKEIKNDFNILSKSQKEIIIDMLFSKKSLGKDKLTYSIGSSIAYDRNNKGDKSVWVKYVRYLFPSYNIMRDKFNYCNKYKYLLPIAWIHRIITGGITKEKSIIKKVGLIIKSFKVSRKKIKIMKELEL